MTNKLLNAELFKNIEEKLVKRQDFQKSYDKTAHPLTKLKEIARKLNFINKTFVSALVILKDKLRPRSCYIKTNSGKILRHNRKYIRKSNKFFKIEINLNAKIIAYSEVSTNFHVSVNQELRSVHRTPAYLNDYIL